MPLDKTTQTSSIFRSADDRPISSRTRNKTLAEARSQTNSQTRKGKRKKFRVDQGDATGRKSKKRKIKQTLKRTRSSKRLMLQKLNECGPKKLQNLFGTADVGWSIFIHGIYTSIKNSEPENLKAILDLGIFDFGIEIRDPFGTDNSDTYGVHSNDKMMAKIKPVSLATNLGRFDCLKVILGSKKFLEWGLKSYPVVSYCLVDCIWFLSFCDSSQFHGYLKCCKLLLANGAYLSKDPWPSYFFERIHETSEHIQVLYAAGAEFELDNDLVEKDTSGFLKYLHRKYNPEPDSSGFYQPKMLQDSCRDFIRHLPVINFYRGNNFLFSRILVKMGYLTKTAADFLVFNVSLD